MRFTTSDGLNLYYEDEGSGVPVLCLAGLTRNVRDFDWVAPHLSDLRLIRMDYRGRGLSDWDPDWSNYNVMREAQDAVELLDHLGIGKVCVLGTSRGGLLAMVLAAGYRDRLSGAILNDVGPVIETGGLADIMAYVGRQPSAKTFEQAAAGLARFYGPAFPGVPDAVWLQAAKAQLADAGDGLALRYDAHLRDALVAQAEAGPAPDLWPLFEALAGLPLGVIRGANSDLLSAETLAGMQARHPGLIAETVPDRGHVPFLDEPQSLRVIRAVLEQA